MIYSIIVSILHKFKYDNIGILILLSILMMCFRVDYFRFDIGRHFFIYFAIGYFLAARRIDDYHKFSRKYLFLFILLSIIGFLYWNPLKDFTNPLNIESWYLFIFRVFVGVVSSISVLEILFLFYRRIEGNRIVQFFSRIGQETLFIYLIQDTFIYIMMLLVINHVALPFSSLIHFIPSVLFVICCYFPALIFSKNKILSWILLGKK